MRELHRRWVLGLVLLVAAVSSPAVTAPLDLLWVVRVGPLSASEPFSPVWTELTRLVRLAERSRARATVLLSGDVAEEIRARGRAPAVMLWIHEGFEVGTYVPLIVREGTRRWRPVTGSSRFGEQGYDDTLTRRLWKEHRESVDRLVGAERNRVVEAEPFRCSTEGPLALDNHFEASFSRAGRWLYYTNDYGTHPWRAAGSDEPGAELATDPTSKLVEIDRTGQAGDPFNRAGDVSVLRLKEAFLRTAGREIEGVRTMAFLTCASPSVAALLPEIARLVRFLSRSCSGRGRRARWSTARTVRTALAAWETAHPSPPGYVHGGPEPEPIALRVRRAQLAGVTRIRSERSRVPTRAENLEFRWWSMTVWRAAIASIDQANAERAFPGVERARIAGALVEGVTPALCQTLDRILAAMEEAARKPPPSRAPAAVSNRSGPQHPTARR